MRNFTIIDAEQRSPAWFAARAGRLTGSRAKDMLAKIKSGEAAARRDYRIQLAAERVTGIPQESGYINSEMQRGIDLEPAARAAYEAFSGSMVRETGFISHNTMLAGCSLDGDVDDFEGIIELKAPKSATHFGYLRAGIVPTDHLPQLTHNLWSTGAKWCDFASFDDRFPVKLQLFVRRIHARDLPLEEYEREAQRFLAEVAVDVQELEQMIKAAA